MKPKVAKQVVFGAARWISNSPYPNHLFMWVRNTGIWLSNACHIYRHSPLHYGRRFPTSFLRKCVHDYSSTVFLPLKFGRIFSYFHGCRIHRKMTDVLFHSYLNTVRLSAVGPFPSSCFVPFCQFSTNTRGLWWVSSSQINFHSILFQC